MDSIKCYLKKCSQEFESYEQQLNLLDLHAGDGSNKADWRFCIFHSPGGAQVQSCMTVLALRTCVILSSIATHQIAVSIRIISIANIHVWF
jgi:3-hydroxy-3-methylglutaryl CoA synthase